MTDLLLILVVLVLSYAFFGVLGFVGGVLLLILFALVRPKVKERGEPVDE